MSMTVCARAIIWSPSRSTQCATMRSRQLLLKYNAAGVDVNVSAAGEQITNVWGNDPVIAEQLRRVPPSAAVVSNAHPVGETPDEAMAREEAQRVENAQVRR